MADVLASGTLDGAGTLTGTPAYIYNLPGLLGGVGDVVGSPVRVHLVSGLLDGAGSLTGTAHRTMIVGGQTYGAGSLFDELEQDVSGQMIGSGTLHGTPHRILSAQPLPMVGSGTLGDHFPLPMIGQGDLSAYLEIIRAPSVCPPVLKTFRWNHVFGPGDLTLCLRDATGMPYGPVVIVYSFMRMCESGGRVIVGPPDLRPANSSLGCYYATGTAGECGGQPGRWLIQWRWQRFWYEAPSIYEQSFVVQDAIASGDYTPSTCKKGWL